MGWFMRVGNSEVVRLGRFSGLRSFERVHKEQEMHMKRSGGYGEGGNRADSGKVCFQPLAR